MGPRTAVFLAILGAVVLAASGCVGDASSVYRGPAGVPLDAGSETGDGDFTVQVKVVAETSGGAAMAGAPVVIHHIPKPATAPSVSELLRTNTSLGGRTGPDGILRAHLHKGQTYTFLAAVPNWTTEARSLILITDEYASAPLHIALLKTSQLVETKGAIPITLHPDTPVINSGATNAKWWPTEVRFHADNATHRQYLHRLHRFDATLTVNGASAAYANVQLRAVLTSDAGNPFVWDTRGGSIPPSAQSVKRLTLTPADLANLAGAKNPILRIGPMTFESTAAPECIPWDLQIDAGFDTAARPQARRVGYYGYGPDAAPVPQPPASC